MPKTTLNPDGLPVPRGSYALVNIAQPGRMVFIAGQTASDHEGKVVGVGDPGDELLHLTHLLVASEEHPGDPRRAAVSFRSGVGGAGGGRLDAEGLAVAHRSLAPHIARERVQHFTVVLLSKANATSGNVS